MYKKKIALVGIGYWGKIYFKYLKKIKNIEIKYIVFKKNTKNFKIKFLKDYSLTKNLDQVLNDKKITHVNLVTPINTHYKLALKCLKKK